MVWLILAFNTVFEKDLHEDTTDNTADGKSEAKSEYQAIEKHDHQDPLKRSDIVKSKLITNQLTNVSKSEKHNFKDYRNAPHLLAESESSLWS